MQLNSCIVPCFKCGAKLQNLSNDDNQPLGGLEFSCVAHYGSIYDDTPGTLIINICDECLTESEHVMQKLVQRSETKTLVRWKK